MAKVTFFAGLCGSGKTYQSKQLEQEYSERGERVKMFREIIGHAATDVPLLIRMLKEDIDCIVEEAFYCVPHHRDCIQRRLEQEVSEAEIEWHLFENNLDAANWNVQNRPYENAMGARLVEEERLRLIKLNTEMLHPRFDAGDITTIPIHRLVLARPGGGV